MEFNIEQIAYEIVKEYGYEWNGKEVIKLDSVLFEKIARECDLAVVDLRNNLLDEVLYQFEKEDIGVSM